jgi:F-type H+-transporting ATPase subunit gamma
MKLICFASLLASAAAFTSSGAAFTTQSHSVGERSVNVAAGAAHRTRKATIVMDGKANGT